MEFGGESALKLVADAPERRRGAHALEGVRAGGRPARLRAHDSRRRGRPAARSPAVPPVLAHPGRGHRRAPPRRRGDVDPRRDPRAARPHRPRARRDRRASRCIPSDANFVLFMPPGRRDARCGRRCSIAASWSAISPRWCPTPCGSPPAPNMRSTCSSPASGRSCTHEPHRAASRARRRRPTSGSSSTWTARRTRPPTPAIPFFDHMLQQLGKHAGWDLDVTCKGDLEVDGHHTVEDCRHRARAGAVRGARRQGRHPAVRLDRGAARRSRGRGGARPFRTQVRGVRRAGARRDDRGLRHRADRGLRARVRAERRASRSTCTCATGARPTTSAKPSSRRWRRRWATRCASPGAAAFPRRREPCDRSRSSTTAWATCTPSRARSRASEATPRSPATRPRSRGADALVIPGVGHFGACMRALCHTASDESIRDFAASGRPVFGVCVGMQVLFEGSEEDAEPGLGRAPGRLRRLPDDVKVPHMGWNTVAWRAAHPYVAGVDEGTRFYFVHSFAPDADAATRSAPRRTAARSRRRSRTTTCSPRSSTRRSPGDAGLADLRALREGGGGMIVIPAIDLRGGRAVRLFRGDPDAETSYSEDPVEVAEAFQEEGARRLHVVDLDAALGAGRTTVRSSRRSAARSQIPVQVGGGLRSLEDIGALLEAGAARAILGTAAAADPDFVHARRRGVRRGHRRGDRRPRRSRDGARLAGGGPAAGGRDPGARRRGCAALPGHVDRARRHAEGPRPASSTSACSSSPRPR